jgi:adenylate cyclase
LAAALVATGHAIFEYFAVATAMRQVIRLIWSYCDDLTPEERHRIIPVGMRRKLLFVSIFVVFMPLVVLGYTVLLKVNHLLAGLGIEDVTHLTTALQMWVTLLIAGGTTVMLFMSFAMARSHLLSGRDSAGHAPGGERRT